MPKPSQTRSRKGSSPKGSSRKGSSRTQAAKSRPAMKKRSSAARGRPAPSRRPTRGGADEQPHVMSPTAVAAEALSTGVRPSRAPMEREMPQQSELLQVGDVENSPLQAAYVGDEAPGGDMPTPDQDSVDDIGRAYGLSEADTGELHTSSEMLTKRDRKRADLEAPRGRRGTRDSDRLR